MGMLSEVSNEFHKFWTRLSSGSIASSVDTWGPYPPQEPMLERAEEFFSRDKTDEFQSLVAKKTEDLRHFDVTRMNRAVAICASGRSGSVLLASYLDGHGDVILMPNLLSHKIYPFFERYRSWSLREKLLAFPFFQTAEADNFLDFFGGDFPIGAADYHAAVNAIFEVFGDWPRELLESRKSFFQFVHVAYCVALGHRPVVASPMIVYAQHMLDDELAKRFVEDFPQGRFIQTVRDPITTTDRLFEHSLEHRGSMAPWSVISYLTFAGLPHPGMEARTQVIRFEDLHQCLEQTMRGLAAWLGLAYSESLLKSTFHDRPYMWKSGANVWTGVRSKPIIRESRYTSLTDRWLLFALLNEDFMAWHYSCPKYFRHVFIRILTSTVVLLIPMKMEFISASRLFKSPTKSVRKVLNGVVRICLCRVGIMSLVIAELYRRLVSGKKVLGMRSGPFATAEASGSE
jgi:Sulfotransferase family